MHAHSDDLNLGPLQKALMSLEDILEQPKNKYIVAGVVQNFAFTFELSWKAMQRYLKIQGVQTGSPNQVLRASKKEGLIEDLDLWLAFLKHRNLTVHTYNVEVAEEVYVMATQLPKEVRCLLDQLTQVL